MLRKICFGILALLTLLRLGSGAYELYMGNNTFNRFPHSIFVSSGIVVLIGLILLVKNLFRAATMREMQVFYWINGLGTLFNLIFFKLMVRVELTVWDFLFLGTVLDVLLMLVMPAMCRKSQRNEQ